MYMMDIMSSVFQEGESLSQEILDSILTNLIEPTKVWVLFASAGPEFSVYCVCVSHSPIRRLSMGLRLIS